LWKVPQPWKSEAVACGGFFLMISTAAWKAQTAFHTYHKPDDDTFNPKLGDQQTKNPTCLIYR
jgi:hypothetical protein